MEWIALREDQFLHTTEQLATAFKFICTTSPWPAPMASLGTTKGG